MRVSARGVAALGAVGLALGNLGRIPGVALGGRTAPLILADVIVVILWVMILIALGSGAIRPVIDDVMSAALAFLGVAAVSTTLAFARYNLHLADGAGVAGFLMRLIAYFGLYPFVLWCLTPDESRDAWRYIELVRL